MDTAREKPKAQKREIQKSQSSEHEEGICQRFFCLPTKQRAEKLCFPCSKKVSELYFKTELPKALKSHF